MLTRLSKSLPCYRDASGALQKELASSSDCWVFTDRAATLDVIMAGGRLRTLCCGSAWQCPAVLSHGDVRGLCRPTQQPPATAEHLKRGQSFEC